MKAIGMYDAVATGRCDLVSHPIWHEYRGEGHSRRRNECHKGDAVDADTSHGD